MGIKVTRPASYELDLHRYGKDQRPASGLIVEEATDRLLHLRIDHGPLHLHVAAVHQRLFDHVLGLLQQGLGLAQLDETALHDLGTADQTGIFSVNHEHDDKHTVAREVFSVSKHLMSQLAQAIDVDRLSMDASNDPSTSLADVEHVSVGQHEAVVLRDPDRLGQLAVVDHVPVLAVDWDEELGTHQAEHELQLFVGGMAVHVDVGHRAVEDLGALPVKVVDSARNQLLVSGDRGCGKHDGIAGLDLHEAVVFVG